MLLAEVKEELKKYEKEDLALIICELYKAAPKKLREEKDLDEIIKDIRAYKAIGKVDKEQPKRALAELKPEIECFIDYAYHQYYFAPNQYVHKKERPKWRFKVKSYIKELNAIAGDDGKAAAELLRRLYGLLSYACAYWTFSTDNPFRSIGIEQTDALGMAIIKTLEDGVNSQNIKAVVELTINSHVDRETLHSELLHVLLRNLKTTDAKELALEQCIALQADLKTPPSKGKKSSGSSSEYYRQEKNNNITELVFYIYWSLCEQEEALKYFHKNYSERNKEISLYILLRILFSYDEKDYWIREYERAVSGGIKPRNGLEKTYNLTKENGEFPEYFCY